MSTVHSCHKKDTIISVDYVPINSRPYPELQSVSPPTSGPVITLRDVVLGGWSS